MKSFKDYKPSEGGSNGPKPSEGREWGKVESESSEELVRRVALEYEGKSNMEMMKAILKEAETAKREGRLSNEQLDEFYEQFSPMVSGFHKRKLKEIVENLKKL